MLLSLRSSVWFPSPIVKPPQHETYEATLAECWAVVRRSSRGASILVIVACTVCPTRFRTRHFLNNSNTNEDIATKFEQEYVRCVRNEEECLCSAPNYCDILISGKIIKEMPGSVASGTHCILTFWRQNYFFNFSTSCI